MTITETKQALGSWAITLRPDTPRKVLDALTYFGHVAVVAGPANVAEMGDNLLDSARYVGVFRSRAANNGYTLAGAGMAFWLGDEDDKGDVLESAVTLTAQTFANSVTALLPPGGAVTAGTISSVAGTYTGRHQWETSRKAITYVTDQFSTPSVPVEWRVTNKARLDAGPVSNLYVTTPQVLIARRPGGRDLSLTVLPGQAGLSKDVDDYTTRVVLLAEGEGAAVATGDADAVGVTLKNFYGNPVKLTRMVSESDTSAANADSRAQLMLNRFSSPRQAVELSTSAYDVKGDARVGDYVWVYDPDNGFVNAANEITWEGENLNPVSLRCVEMTWPVIDGYTVAFRDGNGVWTDLTPYFVPEAGDTTIVVGDLANSWSGVGSEPIGSRPSVDTSTPSTPPFVTPFQTIAYQSSAANDIRAAVLVKWTEPLNVDGSTILDGHHYEIRARTTQVGNYAVTWAQLCGFADAIEEPFDHTISNAWGNGWITSGGIASEYNVASGVGSMLISGTNTSRKVYKAVSVLNGRMKFDWRCDQLSTGAATYVSAALRHDQVGDDYYMMQARLRPDDATIGLRVVRRVAGVETTVGDLVLPTSELMHVAADWYSLECTIQTVGANTQIWGRVWKRDNPAPNWQIKASEATPAQLGAADAAGIRVFRGSGSTNPNPTIYFDNVEFTAWNTGFTWDQAQTWGRPLSLPTPTGEWQTYYSGWDTDQFLLQELVVAADYEVQIRAVDSATPPNSSAWSTSSFFTTTSDLIPPAQPAAPFVASSRIAIQVLHTLGMQSGGTYNLAPDLHHLEVHVGGSAGFLPDDSTLVGSLSANESNIVGHIAAVGTFLIEDVGPVWVKVIAVDRFGNKSSASEAATGQAELIDDAHITSLTASKITAGTISTNILLAGTIRTAESGQRAELNSEGLVLYDSNGDPTVNITADDSSPNFFAVTDGPEVTLASIDQNGNINGQVGNFAEDVIIDGSSFLTDYYYPLPKGTVAYGSYTEAENGDPRYSAGVIGAPGKGFMELSFFAEAGRLYNVKCNSQVISTVASEEYAFELRDGGSSTPTTASTRLSRAEVAGSAENFAVDLTLDYTGEFTDGLHRLLWCFFGFDGTASIYLDNHPAVMTITDIGPAVGNTAVINEGGGTAPPPVTTYTKSYSCNWGGSYTGTGSKKTDATTANQGYYSSTHGNQRSLLGFPYATIMNDLNGATIVKCEVTLYAEHWYYNAGGTAVIGTHGYSSEPSTWSDGSVNQDRLRSSGWPKPGKRTVNLGTTIGNDFKSGAARGIALGPGPSTSLDYYGKFSDNGASASGNRPVLKITYTK